MYKVEKIKWEEIKEVWESELWPDKKGGVKSVNNWTWFHPSTSLSQDKGIEKSEFGIPYFFGIKIDSLLNSHVHQKHAPFLDTPLFKLCSNIFNISIILNRRVLT